MTMQKLVKNWELPDLTNERTQLTLRLDFDLYAKLHALKEVYPKRSVNDMINDILKTSLDEIIEALPIRTLTREEAEELSYQIGEPASEIEGRLTGPRITFDSAYRHILKTKSEEGT